MNFFLTAWTHKFLRLVPKVMLQKLIRHMLTSYVKYLVKFVREPKAGNAICMTEEIPKL